MTWTRRTSVTLAVVLGVAGAVQGAYSNLPNDSDDPCTNALGEYDLDLHIVAIFVLLVASGLGVFFPVILGQRKKGSTTVDNVFFVLRHFGSGVIISTAYVHLLQEAFLYFHSDCMGKLAYPASAMAICMAATMVIFTVDFAAARCLYNRRIKQRSIATEGPEAPAREKAQDLGHSHDFGEMDIATGDEYNRRALLDLEILEGGIVFHSVFIGVTLGAQGGTEFLPTFIALVFHQCFEGLGLGARIGRLEYPDKSKWQKWAMCIVYTLITPLGIAIGIGVRQTVNFSSHTTLLVVGTFDAISAGILLYGGIAQILVGDWLAGDIRRAPLKRVLAGAASLTAGLIAMSVIGQWT